VEGSGAPEESGAAASPGELTPSSTEGCGPLLQPCHQYQLPGGSRRDCGPFPRYLLSCAGTVTTASTNTEAEPAGEVVVASRVVCSALLEELLSSLESVRLGSVC
jgi:hypothetical protein